MKARTNEQTAGRGFASMDERKKRQIASQGGRAAHRLGTAHEFTSEEARSAGRKGGGAVSMNRAHMAEIGRRGGEASHMRRASRRMSQSNDGSQTAEIAQPRAAAVDGAELAASPASFSASASRDAGE